MEQYLSQNSILMKHFGDHCKQISERIKRESLKPFYEQKLPVPFLRSAAADKEAVARKVAAERSIKSGVVCAISTLEPSPTFEHRKTHIIRRERPCHVLYHYQIDPEMGWMHARIQTWFPFNIQIAVNGREWLARQMDRIGLQYRQQGNCFVWIEDYEQAQKLMDQQLQVNWAERLNGFAQGLNPAHQAIFERYETEYYWTCYQSEWATDVTFRDQDFLKRLMGLLVRHGIMSFSSTDVMHYFGRKVNQNGSIPASFNGTLQIDLKRYQEGDRVKYKLNGNSAKFYDKAYSPYGSVLRGAETTLNQVEDLRVYPAERRRPGRRPAMASHAQGYSGPAAACRGLGQGQRATAGCLGHGGRQSTSGGTHCRYSATHHLERPAGTRLCVPGATTSHSSRLINHGEFLINGFRNRDLQSLLYPSEPFPPRNAVDAPPRSAESSECYGLMG